MTSSSGVKYAFLECHLRNLTCLDLSKVKCKDVMKCYTNMVCIEDEELSFPNSVCYLDLTLSELPCYLVSTALQNSANLRQLEAGVTQISISSLMAMSKNLTNLVFLNIKGM